MIMIAYWLCCDHCSELFGDGVEKTADVLMTKDLDELRARARETGWRRFRSKTTSPMTDRCSACVARSEVAKAERVGVSAITGRPRNKKPRV
jgi:hypothetical protein